MRILLIAILLLDSVPSLAQSQPLNATTFDLSFAQGTSSDWSTGDQSFFALKCGARTQQNWPLGIVSLHFSTRTDLGARYSGDSAMFPVRISDNEVFSEFIVRGKTGWMVEPYISGSMRTPLTESFRYGADHRFRTAGFWDPVISQEALGYSYVKADPTFSISSRLGIALRQVRAKHNLQLSDDFLTPTIQEAYKAESGVEKVLEGIYNVDSTIRYGGRLEMFGNFEDPSKWIVSFRNEVKLRVWKMVVVTLTLDIANNYKQTARTQLRQALTLGFVQEFGERLQAPAPK